jgi:hypothetical protein
MRLLEWNYYSRRETAKQFLEGKHEQNLDRFFQDSTRHNPALCTAYQRTDGSLFVNAVHDVFHYVPAEKRRTERPVYIFSVEEVYNNSPYAKRVWYKNSLRQTFSKERSAGTPLRKGKINMPRTYLS